MARKDATACRRARHSGAPKAATHRGAAPAEASSVDTDKLGDFLAYFGVSSPEEEIRWSHATNSAARLEAALAEGVHMIEADVLMGALSPSASEGRSSAGAAQGSDDGGGAARGRPARVSAHHGPPAADDIRPHGRAVP